MAELACWISTGYQRSTAAAFQRTYLRRVVVPVAARAGLEEHYAYLEASLARYDGRNRKHLRCRRASSRPVVGPSPVA